MSQDDVEVYSFSVPDECFGLRADKFLSELETLQQTRSQIKKLMNEGNVLVDGKLIKPSYKLRENDVLTFFVPPPKSLEVEPEDIPLSIVFEDEHLVVVNKPAGMVVHPGPGHSSGTLVHALLHHCQDLSGIGGVLRPGIVHRLDKDTTGALVVAKNDRTHQALCDYFKHREQGHIERRYLCLIYGRMKEQHGVIETFFGRSPNHRQKFSSRVLQGKKAITEYWCREEFSQVSLCEVKLHTGRTHQIRVHFSDIHRPLVGDVTYGQTNSSSHPKILRDFPRQALHAWKLSFLHPISHCDLSFEVPLPQDFDRLLQGVRRLP